MNQATQLLNPANTKTIPDLLVREFNQCSVFSALSGEWDALSLRCTTGSPFLTSVWHKLWWNSGNQDRRLRIITLYEPDGTLCGIAPLCSESTADDAALTLLGSPDFCDYRDFIVATGSEARFFDTLMRYLMAHPARRVVLSLSSLQQHSPTLSVFSKLARTNGFTVTITPEDTAPCMNLPSDFETYLNGLTAKERHEIRRKKRRAEKEGTLSFERICEPSRVMAAMPSFLSLFRLSGGMKHSFLTPEREAFFLSLADTFCGRGWLDLYVLSLNGNAIAYLLCFCYNQTLYLYNAAYDNRYARVSPGIVAIAMCIEDAIQRGMWRFEFLRGNETYKYRFGGHDHQIYTLTCSRRGE